MRGKARVPSEVELKRLLALSRIGKFAKRNSALLQVSFRIGLRAKEMAMLKVVNVLDREGQLREEGLLDASMTKGGRPRIFYLTNSQVRCALVEYIKERRVQEGSLFNYEAPLFLSQKGSSFSPNTMQQLFHRLYQAAGIDGARSHSGRRWFATELISKGVDLKAVSVLMGHSSVAMTARYAEDNPQRLRRIAAELVLT